MAEGERVNSNRPIFSVGARASSDKVSPQNAIFASSLRLLHPISQKWFYAGLGCIFILSLMLLALVFVSTSWTQPNNIQSVLFEEVQFWRLALGLACVALIMVLGATALKHQRKSNKRHLAEIHDLRATFAREKREFITQHQAENARTKAAQHAKTMFLAHLNHNVRTPLNHIIGFAELIKRQTHGAIGDARYLDYLDDIQTSGKNLLESFSSILELAELEEGDRTVKTEIVDVRALIETVQYKFNPRTQQAGISFEVTSPEEVHIHADIHSVIRMLGNLVDNAVKFTPRGGKISLCAWQAADGVAFEIADSGIGIPEHRLRELGAPFSNHGVAYEDGSGKNLGMGLSIARAIAKSNGGELIIESLPSIGTTVAVSLPCAMASLEDRTQAA